jgi:hypothetical protein
VSHVVEVPAGGRAWQGTQGVWRTNSKGSYKNCNPSLALQDLSSSSPVDGAQEHLQGGEEGRSSGEGAGKERVRDKPVCPSKPQPPLSSVTYVQNEKRLMEQRMLLEIESF